MRMAHDFNRDLHYGVFDPSSPVTPPCKIMGFPVEFTHRERTALQGDRADLALVTQYIDQTASGEVYRAFCRLIRRPS